MTDRVISYRKLSGFDDREITEAVWNKLLAEGPVNNIFLTHQWQRTWWEVYGRGELIIIVAEQHSLPVAIAPIFADSGMIFFVGSGGSDYLDFIGNVSGPGVLEQLLQAAIKETAAFLGFRFYHVREDSPTRKLLATSVDLWTVYDEGDLPAPMLEIKKFTDQAWAATRKKSLLRHEGWFVKNGGFVVTHHSESADILSQLPSFFAQHESRWEQTAYPSLFKEEKHRIFFARICEVLGPTGWLRFTGIIWQGKPVAYHFGFLYAGSFLWYKPTFDISLSKYSPGEVLIRQLLLWAIDSHVEVFDFGLGDENFKKRFATATINVHTIGLYPESVIKEKKL